MILARKLVEDVRPARKKQLLTCLRLLDLRLGLAIHFGGGVIGEEIFRVVNGLPEDQ